MPKVDLPEIELRAWTAISDWNGWPAPDWIVDHLRRKFKYTEDQVREAMLNLRKKGVIAFVKHKDETVVRVE